MGMKGELSMGSSMLFDGAVSRGVYIELIDESATMRKEKAEGTDCH